MSITVAGDIRIPLADISPEQVRHLRRGATITVRERQHAYGEMRWVETPRDLSVLEESHIVLPRGMLGEVQRVLGRVDVAGATARSEHGYTLRVGLRPHQREIAEIAKWKVQGIITAATGAGKTGAAFAIAAAVGQRMLVLVPTVALADQWRTEAMRFLGVEAATSTGGEWTDAPIVIATPTTATNHAERLGAYGLLVVDEVQGFATELRVALIRQIPARWRIGMTATLPRDHRGDVLRRVFGPVLYRYGVADGLASGTLVDPIYEQVETSFTAAYTGPEDWQALLEALVTDPSRNTQIADIVESRCADVCTLVLSSRIAHLETLRDIFAARGKRSAILSGRVPARERTSILEAARAGELDVLLGSTVADEGIDVPGLGALVLAFPSRAEPRLLQRIGRVVRATPAKPRPLIFDLVDRVGPLASQARARRKAFAGAFGVGAAA